MRKEISGPQADLLLTFSVEGPAELIGVDNGNPEGMESLRGDRMHAFHGRALAVIRFYGRGRREAVVTVACGRGFREH